MRAVLLVVLMLASIVPSGPLPILFAGTGAVGSCDEACCCSVALASSCCSSGAPRVALESSCGCEGREGPRTVGFRMPVLHLERVELEVATLAGAPSLEPFETKWVGHEPVPETPPPRNGRTSLLPRFVGPQRPDARTS